jgi:two-component system, OmpR family, phosphate regulon response regulator PhoB
MSMDKGTLPPYGHIPSTTILVVEDDAATAELFALTLSQELHSLPLVAASGSQALSLIREMKPDLAIIDYHLSDMTGIAFYDSFHAQEEFRDIAAIILSASLPLHLQEIHARKLHCLEKPFDLDAFLLCVKQVLEA